MLSGIDEGIPFRVDPIPLNATGELVAMLQGLKTFTWIVTGNIAYRDAGRIQTEAKRGNPIVLATHRHGSVKQRRVEVGITDGYIPDPAHIDAANVIKTQRLMEIASRTKDQPVKEYETDENAMWLLGSLMGGKVISEKAPF
jgi:hypothetical protein